MSDSDCGSEPVSYTAIKLDCTRGFVVEVFNDLDQVGVNVIRPYSTLKGFMPYSVKRLFKIIKKNVIEVLMMLEVTLAQHPKIEDLFCRTASWSETCLFFGYD